MKKTDFNSYFGGGMSNKYKLEVHEIEGKFPIVRIIFDYGEESYINTYADLSEPLDIGTMQEWCTENECGWRTSYDTFKFRNQDQLLMFVLRWS
jgi:hypothetical protein